jgi:hypothetical protein
VSDFLDRYGEQLHAAQLGGHRLRWARACSARRTLLISLGALAIAAPAVAVVRPWEPTLGRPGVDEGAATTTTAAAPAAARDVMAVLRRSQTANDRAKATPLLRSVDAQFTGVQTESIRALRDNWALVPAASVATGPDRTLENALCITDGEGTACGPANAVRDRGIHMISSSATATTVVGLVPDGVTRVRFTPAKGRAATVTAGSNFFSLSVPETQARDTIPAPDDKSWTGPAKIEGPPMPVEGSLEWLAADGSVVGPSQPSVLGG